MKNTKEQILQTSLLLFLQKSYKDVTMSEIVKQTGMSKGAIFHYFSSKEALFKEIAQMFFSMGATNYSLLNSESLNTFYHEYVDSLSNSIQQLNQMLSGSYSKSVSINFFFIMFEAINRFPEFLKLELELHKKDLEAWMGIINNARKKHEIKSDSSDKDLAMLFLYCNDGAFIRYMNSGNEIGFKDLLLNAYDSIYSNIKL